MLELSSFDSQKSVRPVICGLNIKYAKLGEPVEITIINDYKKAIQAKLVKAGVNILSYVRPGDSFETRPATFRYTGGKPLEDPVWVDLLTGGIYAFPKDAQLVSGRSIRFVRVPVYDSPCLLTERRMLIK